MDRTTLDRILAGADLDHPLDALFVNAPLRDYAVRPRLNDFTLPVLGMAYIATYARAHGYNVGVIDAESRGLGITPTATIINAARPRWVGFNLLAPTYDVSARIATELADTIRIMVGGHQAKAMPTQILADPRFVHLDALVMGEGETRVTALLADHRNRADLPGVMWNDPILHTPVAGSRPGQNWHLAPDIDELPFIDRVFLTDDPYRASDGRQEANMVGARGCPYDCSFCGAAASANPDVSIRVRKPEDILAEMDQLRERYGVTAFRFVDDLFLGARRVIDTMQHAFRDAHVGDWAVWDATGRINVLDRASDETLDRLLAAGLRESRPRGRVRQRTHAQLHRQTHQPTHDHPRHPPARRTRNLRQGLLHPGPSHRDPTRNGRHRGAGTHSVADHRPAARSIQGQRLRVPPLPGHTRMGPDHGHRPVPPGRPARLCPVDLTAGGLDESMRARDEFNFSVNIQFGEPTITEVRHHLLALSREQYDRAAAAA
jgi:anaerobic magnesium-protoporphyrin IX monomethyl ester cyclase